MTGRGALLLVGCSVVVFLLMNASMGTSDAIDNFARYENRSNAYAIALSGANIAGDLLYFNKFYEGTYRDKLAFQGGTLSIVVERIGDLTRVTSSGTYPASGLDQVTEEVVSNFSPGYYDRFVLLTDNDPGSIPWTTYDTANGNLHSNNTLTIDHYGGNPVMPVFNGAVSAAKSINITPGTKPVFSQPPQTGMIVEFPTDFDPVTAPPFLPGGADWNTSYQINNGNTLVSREQLHLQFFIDGSGQQMVRYFGNDVRLTNNGYGDFRATDSVVSAPANGIIYAPGVDVFVEGTVEQKLSILCTPKATGTGGNIFVTNDLVCKTNPTEYSSSPDYIGLLAYNNVVIANTKNDDATNSGSNRVKIQASIVALKGGLTAADNITRKRQILDIYGSITQAVRKGVGSGSSAIGSASGGFMKHYYYDARLINNHALLMPKTPLLCLDSFLVRRGSN
jgi:hypothetical protein